MKRETIHVVYAALLRLYEEVKVKQSLKFDEEDD